MWEALDGGNISGEGASITFEPPNTGPHACPYRVKVTVTSDLSGLLISDTIDIHVSLEGDNDHDGDVDGTDLCTIGRRQHHQQ